MNGIEMLQTFLAVFAAMQADRIVKYLRTRRAR